MPSGINLVTGLPFEANQYESEHNILDAEMKDLVLSEIPNKSAKHKSKKGKGAEKGAEKSAEKAADKGAEKKASNTTAAAEAATDAKEQPKAAK